jgi:hypothetical protein
MTIKIKKNFHSELLSIRYLIIKAAQKIYDNWETESEEEPEGGICDEIEQMISSIISTKTSAKEVYLGGHDGDDHAWTIAKKGKEIYGINIPADIYEIGRGYSWKKRKNVKFKIDDVDIFRIE